jgi:hypothetical protein
MALQTVTPKGYFKAIGVGIATAVILSLVMVPAFKMGISPLPKPLGLAFAQVLFGDVPLPVGLLFHVAYVTFWSVVYLAFFERRTFLNALWLALGLWLGVLVIFFPIVGWGFFGLAVSPKLIVASLVPHVLFAAVLWYLSSWAFPASAQSYRQSA